MIVQTMKRITFDGKRETHNSSFGNLTARHWSKQSSGKRSQSDSALVRSKRNLRRTTEPRTELKKVKTLITLRRINPT